MATEVQKEFLSAQDKLPQQNAAVDVFKLIIDGYTVAGTLFSGKVKNSPQDPIGIVAEAYIRKTLLRRILTGRATEHDWQAFEAGKRVEK